jgi:hypothetical protein
VSKVYEELPSHPPREKGTSREEKKEENRKEKGFTVIFVSFQ